MAQSNTDRHDGEMPTGLAVLALDGGGVRGLSQLVILQEIMERIGNRPGMDELFRPCQVFDLICGTSAGGLAALMLGRLRMTASQCLASYVNISREAFAKEKFIPGARHEAFSATTLEREIKKLIQQHGDIQHEDEMMMDRRVSACKTFVCAVSGEVVGNRMPRIFRTYRIPGINYDVKIWEAARATTAAPRFFKPMTIKLPHGGVSETFIDGGLGCNNPSEEAFKEVVTVLTPQVHNIDCFVSIGTGDAPTVQIPKRTMFSRALPIGWIEALRRVATDCHQVHQTMTIHFRDQPDTYFRFDTPGMYDIGLEEWERLGEIQSKARTYLEAAAIQPILNKLASTLRSRWNNRSGSANQSMTQEIVSGSISRSPNTCQGSTNFVVVNEALQRGQEHSTQGSIHQRQGHPADEVSTHLPSLRPSLSRSESAPMPLQRRITMRSRYPTINHGLRTPSRSNTLESMPSLEAARSLQADELAVNDMLAAIQAEREVEPLQRIQHQSTLTETVPLSPYSVTEMGENPENTEATCVLMQLKLDHEESNQRLQEQRRVCEEKSATLIELDEQEFLKRMLPDPRDPQSLFYVRDLKADACQGTARWITQTESYQKWQSPRSLQVLMIIGPPGQGKSVLTKNTAAKLRSEVGTTLIVEVYCQDSALYNSSLYIIKSILHQVLSKHRQLFSHCRKMVIEGSLELDEFNSFKPLWKLLLSLLSDAAAPEIFCFIDGLDECVSESREELLSHIFRDFKREDQTDQSSNRKSRFCITSRDVTPIDHYSPLAHEIRIRIEDVQPDINNYVMSEFTRLVSQVDQDRWSKLFVALLSQRSDGMFLWISLVLEEFLHEGRKLTIQELIATATAVPGRLYGLYLRILQCIPEDRQNKARRVLETLLFSPYTLSVQEFGIAMMDLPDEPLTNEFFSRNRNHATAHEAKQLCGSLIEIKDDTIRLNHHSIRQFLIDGAEHEDFPRPFLFNRREAHLKRAVLCIRYLMMSDIDLSGRQLPLLVDRESTPYLTEALAAWPVHLRGSGDYVEREMPLVKEFFMSQRFLHCLKVHTHFHPYLKQKNIDERRLLLEALVFFGLSNILYKTVTENNVAGSDTMTEPPVVSWTPAHVVSNSPSGQPILHVALWSKQAEDVRIDVMERLLQLGADPNLKSEGGITVLHVCAFAGEVDVLRLILPRTTSVNIGDHDGETGLFIAAQQGHLEFIKELVQEGKADIHVADNQAYTPLHTASLHGHKDVVRYLLSLGARQSPSSDGYYPLHLACVEGETDTAMVLLNNDAPIDCATSETSTTPLHLAASRGHFRTVRLLLNRGGKCTAKDSDGSTALHFAVVGENAQIVKEVLQVMKDDVSFLDIADDRDGETALHMAARLTKTQIAELLIEAGADANAISGDSKTPLVIAASCGNLEMVKMLVQSGADAGFVAQDKVPMLLIAIYYGHDEIAEYLIQHGASVHLTWKFYTPIYVATWMNRPRLIEMLLPKQIDMRIISDTGITLLHYAAQHGLDRFVEQFIRTGIDINASTKNKWTPLHCAAAEGNNSTVMLLLRNEAHLNAVTEDNLTPIFLSISNDHVELAELLLNRRPDVKKSSKKGFTVMHAAAEINSARLIRKLHDNHGVAIDSRTVDGWRPLHSAVSKGNSAAVEELLARNANPLLGDDYGYTPMHAAASKNHLGLIKRLLRAGAPVHVVCDKDYGTPLLYVSDELDSTAALDLFLRKGAIVNFENRHCRTALHAAAAMSNIANVEKLLENDGNPNHVDSFQMSPLDEAAQNQNLAIVELMVTHGGKLNHLDGYARTPLFWSRRLYPDVDQRFPEHQEPGMPEDDAFITQITCVAMVARERILATWSASNLHIQAFIWGVLANCLGFLGRGDDAAICCESRMIVQGEKTKHLAICDVGGHDIGEIRMFCLDCTNTDLCTEHYDEYREKNLKVQGCQNHKFVAVPRAVFPSLEEGLVNDKGEDLKTWLTNLEFEI